MQTTVKDITPQELKARVDAGENLILLDIREEWERKICSLSGPHIPMDEIFGRESEIPRDRDVVVYCRAGGRSKRVIEALQAQKGFSNLINLAGGILAWGDQIDRSMEQY